MKIATIALALASLLGASALADEPGGIVGSVVDTSTGKPVANVSIMITRVEAYPRSWNVKTNARGTFSNVSLEPGRYLVVATLPGETLGCAVDDIYGGEMVHMKIGIGGTSLTCSGPRVHPAMVDPNTAADVYRIQ